VHVTEGSLLFGCTESILPLGERAGDCEAGHLVRWHRIGFHLFWRHKSRHGGRPPLPKNLRALVVTMARENPSWGEGRIADELSPKLGLAPTVSGRCR
jgi:hypothetical protein